MQKAQVISKQVENSQKYEEHLEITALEMQNRIKKIADVPNLQEMLELGLQKLDEEIH